MALFDFLRRGGLRTPADLAAFIDEQAAMIADKAVGDYAALRAGPGASVLLAEPALRAALEKAREEALPLALSMVGEMVEGVLRPLAADQEQGVRGGLIALVLGCLDRRLPLGGAGDGGRRDGRSEVERSLAASAHHSVKPVAAIADAYASLFLALMPIHPKLAGDDYAALSGALRTMLAAAHDRLVERGDLAGLAMQLAAACAHPAQASDPGAATSG